MTPHANLTSHLRQLIHMGGWSSRVAFYEGSESVTFAELLAAVDGRAARMIADGIEVGEVCAVCLPDGLELVTTFLALLHIGAVAVIVNDLAPIAELRRQQQASGAKFFVCDDLHAATFSGQRIDRTASGHHVPTVAVTADSPAYILFTSGTTGDPKLITHFHGSPLLFNDAFGKMLGLGDNDVVFSVARSHFAYGLGNSVLYPLLNGAAAVLVTERPDATQTRAIIEQYGVTVLFSVPTFFARLCRDRHSNSVECRLRLVVSAGEALQPRLATELRRYVGCDVVDSLGCTEAGQAFLAGRVGEIPAGSVGRPLAPFEVRIVKNELQFRSPFTDDFVGTGDRATIDEGFVFVDGRIDDAITISGFTIYPQEIEKVLTDVPSVVEAAVFAVGTDECRVLYGAAVIDGGEVTSDDLMSELRQQLPAYKVPRRLIIVSHLPRTSTGKLRRGELPRLVRKSLAPMGRIWIDFDGTISSFVGAIAGERIRSVLQDEGLLEFSDERGRMLRRAVERRGVSTDILYYRAVSYVRLDRLPDLAKKAMLTDESMGEALRAAGMDVTYAPVGWDIAPTPDGDDLRVSYRIMSAAEVIVEVEEEIPASTLQMFGS